MDNILVALLPTLLLLASSLDIAALRKDNCSAIRADDLLRAAAFCLQHFKLGIQRRLGMARGLLEPLKARYPVVSCADLLTFGWRRCSKYVDCLVVPWKCGRQQTLTSSP